MTASMRTSISPFSRLVAIIAAVVVGIMCLGFANVGQAHAQIQKVYVNGEEATDGELIDCAGGTASYDSSSKTLFLDNASIDENKGFQNVWIMGNSNDTVQIVLSGTNTITYNGSSMGYGITSGPNIVFSGSGSLEVINSYVGVKCDSDITIKSGKFSIDARNSAFRCKRFIMKGGKLSSAAGGTYAVSAKSMSNKPAHLGYVNGRLPNGAKFKKSKNSYTVNGSNGTVTLTKYASTRTSAKVGTVTYGYTYKVNTIGAKAFAKTKVRKVTLGEEVRQVKKLAFANTKSLVRLNVSKFSTSNWVSSSTTRFESKALSKAGANAGSGLTVKISDTVYADKAKQKLCEAGMSWNARVLTKNYRVSVASAGASSSASATPLAAAAF